MDDGLSSDIMDLFAIPPEAETIITGHAEAGVARETIARLSENQQLKVALARVAFKIDQLNETVTLQNSRITKQEDHCGAVQAGTTPFGCAHLEAMRTGVWKFIAAAMGVPIVVALVIAAIIWVMRI